MKLNPDCIRDILLEIEEIPSIKHYYRFDSKSILEKFPTYTVEEIMYHLRQCELHGFLLNPSHGINYEYYVVYDLTPKGHEFLANIRNNNFFNKVKGIAQELGISSLKDLTQIATSCATILIKSHFNLP